MLLRLPRGVLQPLPAQGSMRPRWVLLRLAPQRAHTTWCHCLAPAASRPPQWRAPAASPQCAPTTSWRAPAVSSQCAPATSSPRHAPAGCASAACACSVPRRYRSLARALSLPCLTSPLTSHHQREPSLPLFEPLSRVRYQCEPSLSQAFFTLSYLLTHTFFLAGSIPPFPPFAARRVRG